MNPLIWNDRGRWLIFSGLTPKQVIQSESLANSMKVWTKIATFMMEHIGPR